MVRFELIFDIDTMVCFVVASIHCRYYHVLWQGPGSEHPFPSNLVYPRVSVQPSVLSDSGDEKRINEFVKFPCLQSYSGNVLDVQHHCVFSCLSFTPLQTLTVLSNLEFPLRNLTNFALFEK